MPFRGFIAAFATKGQPFLSQSCTGNFAHHVQLRNPKARQQARRHWRRWHCSRATRRCCRHSRNWPPRRRTKAAPRCLLFQTCSGLRRCLESFCVRLPQVLDVGHQLVDFKHNARILVEICRDGFGHILQFVL